MHIIAKHSSMNSYIENAPFHSLLSEQLLLIKSTYLKDKAIGLANSNVYLYINNMKNIKIAFFYVCMYTHGK